MHKLHFQKYLNIFIYQHILQLFAIQIHIMLSW